MVFAICGIEKSKAATDNNKKKEYDKILQIRKVGKDNGKKIYRNR